MNPFLEEPQNLNYLFMDFCKLYPKSYDKNCTDPYTKTRIILMNGTMVESIFFLHNFQRHCNNNSLRRELSLIRRIKQQQQKKLICLKPIDENILEHTIGYEQLAVDLTARLAQTETDINVKNALNFALLEDFDHLYRFSNLLEMENGIDPKKLVGGYTEIMPARPTIAHARHPFDSVKAFVNFKTAPLLTQLHTLIITAAEQQTMNYYMNVAGFYPSDIGRRLYQEIGLVEEDHVTQYGSLQDPNSTWLEMLLLHEYTECYLYYSCFCTETDPYIKKIWEHFFNNSVSCLHLAVKLLKEYEHKDYTEVIPNGEFPELLKLGSNIEYVRDVLCQTVNYTGNLEDYILVTELEPNARFCKYQNIVTNNNDVCIVPSHIVIDKAICQYGTDIRFEVRKNPIPQLQDRTVDNTTVGRCVQK